METPSGERARRELVVLVGPDRPKRSELAWTLIADGAAVIGCSGSPGCPLVRGEPCPLVDLADAVVVLPTASLQRELTTTISLCAKRAAVAVIMEPTTAAVDGPAVRIPKSDHAREAQIVRSVLRHPSVRMRRKSSA